MRLQRKGERTVRLKVDTHCKGCLSPSLGSSSGPGRFAPTLPDKTSHTQCRNEKGREIQNDLCHSRRTYTHARTHVRTHARTHTHTHTPRKMNKLRVWFLKSPIIRCGSYKSVSPLMLALGCTAGRTVSTFLSSPWTDKQIPNWTRDPYDTVCSLRPAHILTGATSPQWSLWQPAWDRSVRVTRHRQWSLWQPNSWRGLQVRHHDQWSPWQPNMRRGLRVARPEQWLLWQPTCDEIFGSHVMISRNYNNQPVAKVRVTQSGRRSPWQPTCDGVFGSRSQIEGHHDNQPVTGSSGRTSLQGTKTREMKS